MVMIAQACVGNIHRGDILTFYHKVGWEMHGGIGIYYTGTPLQRAPRQR